MHNSAEEKIYPLYVRDPNQNLVEMPTISRAALENL